MKKIPSPTEILQKIIDTNGSCDWLVTDFDTLQFNYICDKCPIGRLYTYKGEDAHKGCIYSVAKKTGVTAPTDAEYKKIAIQLLEDMKIDDMLSKEEDDEDR